MDDCQLAAKFRAALGARIGAQRLDTWFGPPTRFAVGPDVVTVSVSNAFLRDWLRSKFAEELVACCDEVLGLRLPLRFEIDAASDANPPVDSELSVAPAGSSIQNDSKSPTRSRQRNRSSAITNESKPTAASSAARDTSFDAFVVGRSNEYAYHSARMLARGTYQGSPMLFSGPPGIGKTHLLQAVRKEFQRRFPRSQAVYFTAERFTSEYVTSLKGGSLPSFRQKCRGVDLLLIDDVQFFAGKRATLEELQYTVDTVLADGRKLVLASDRPLADLRPLGSEIVSRLSAGVACEIRIPEHRTRAGMVRQFARQMELELSDEVVELVAQNLDAGPRELRGALNHLHLTSLAFRQPISIESTERVLASLSRQSTGLVRLPDVERAVCEVFGIEPALLRSARKARSVRQPRLIAMWLCREHTGAAWSEIGEYFGRKSHSTVIAAHRRVQTMREERAEVELEKRPCDVDEAIRRVEAVLRSA